MLNLVNIAYCEAVNVMKTSNLAGLQCLEMKILTWVAFDL